MAPTEAVDIPPADMDIEDSDGSSDSQKESEQDSGDFGEPENVSKLHLSPIEALQAKYITLLEKGIKYLEHHLTEISYDECVYVHKNIKIWSAKMG